MVRADVIHRGYGLGVDLGTTYTAAAVRGTDGVDVLRLGARRPEVPSLVYLPADGPVLVGEPAARRGESDPGRMAREFKRRLGDPVPLLVGGAPYSAHALLARQLDHVLGTAVTTQGEPPGSVVVTCPANWGPYKRDLLRQATRLADLETVELRTEPEAAAVQFASGERVAPGEIVAVYDLGGGTFDAAVLRRTATGFELLGEPEGIEQLGGVDFDEAVFDHVRATLGDAAILTTEDPDVQAAFARLRRDCVEAKEALSEDTEVLVPVALPGLHTRVRLTRREFEAMIFPALEETVGAMRRALRSAGVPADQLRSILLSGGSSRIPLVTEVLGTAFGCPTALDPHPEHSIALGAARLSAPETFRPSAQPPMVAAGRPRTAGQTVTTPPLTAPPSASGKPVGAAGEATTPTAVPGEAAPGVAVPDDAPPDAAFADEAAPGVAVPNEAPPGAALPDEGPPDAAPPDAALPVAAFGSAAGAGHADRMPGPHSADTSPVGVRRGPGEPGTTDSAPPRRRWRRAVLAVAAVLALGGAAATVAALRPDGRDSGGSSAAACGFADSFDGDTLDPAWQRQRTDTNVTVADGAVTMDAPDGSDIFETYLAAPMLLRPVTGDFTLETDVTAAPSQFYQGAGLVLWNGPDSYVRLERGYGDTGAVVFEYKDHAPHVKVHSPVRSDGTLVETDAQRGILQLIRKGDTITAKARSALDAQPKDLGSIQVNLPQTVPVGVAVLNRAQQGAKPSSFSARFDSVTARC
ncbi:Hsp70 protein [Krasilnikovia cinnamomea]|uniref:Hsp70 protein n=1 Tax=Krasilnikovia cinnamomea TaxID=349313 RepID=A0A4Q7ZCT2_9ACTN|nr:Hsp70 family protein [Krasilnikovia cinnamomea]RZU48477.1 Hsp70 protein [Krasilnikovia cinnamomea]